MLEQTELQRLATLSEEELLTEIGRILEAREGLSAFPNPSRSRRKAAAWVQNALPRLREFICSNLRIRKLIEKGDSTAVAELIEVVTLAIVDAAVFQPVPASSLAAVVVKRGVTRICTDTWNQNDS